MGALFDWFRHAASEFPDSNVAAVCGEATYTYAEMDALSSRCALDLEYQGVRPDSLVGLASVAGPMAQIALLALSRIGAVPVPMPDSGEAELARADRLGVAAVVDGKAVEEWLRSGHQIQLRRTGNGSRAEGFTGHGLAYVLATSGSTSAPKSVPISDTNLESYARHLALRYGRFGQERISQNFRPHFDAFFEVLLLAFATGSTVVYPEGREHLLVDEFIERRRITVWDCVPSQIRLSARIGHLQPGRCAGVKLAIFGGESLTTALLQQWRQAAPNSVCVNTYGPTELTIVCAEYEIQPHQPIPDYAGRVPIGAVLPHLDARLEKVGGAAQEVQELWVRGPQRFAGYLSDTADDSSSAERNPWYRTGDLVETTSHGLVWAGRTDSQVKILGQRVDLAAVEAHLLAVTGSTSVWVTVHNNSVCAVIESGSVGAEDDLRLQDLRDYARPARIVWIDNMPVTTNGKLDASRLRTILHELDDAHVPAPRAIVWSDRDTSAAAP
ncbi:AMP-binding protein [Kribbella sp. NBC_00709]|uniref:AMP-binding protein n=1 Tax=Kribbella sp. NBC_00709 TaxID=2975972 RepID=UPI002E2AF3D4|nr:AMP-binding protein [Kribbella sp. NBC_00709]